MLMRARDLIEVIDHLSDINMVYTEHARKNLLEGYSPKQNN